jgi:hypothetical protein
MKFEILKSRILLALVLFGSIHAAVLTQPVARDLSSPPPSLPPLIATESEVKDFFDKYIERYSRKDIDGFLWLFSLKALQNQKDGLPEIRQAYSDFFKKSRGLDYRLEDFKMEIYQNAAEVKARFRIQQTLTKGKGEKVYQGNIRWVLVREGGALKILSLDYQHQKSP